MALKDAFVHFFLTRRECWKAIFSSGRIFYRRHIVFSWRESLQIKLFPYSLRPAYNNTLKCVDIEDYEYKKNISNKEPSLWKV